MSIAADDPRLADFTPEEVARGVPEQIAEQEAAGAPMQYRVVSDTTTVEGGRRIRRVQYENGVVETSDLGPVDEEEGDGDTGNGDTTDPNAFAREQIAQRRASAFELIRSFLNRYNISGLDSNIQEILSRGIEDADAVLFMLRDTPEFQKRFSANRARVEAGFPELDYATYIGMEDAYRSTMQAFGLPKGFYDDQQDFDKLIAGDVSVAELTNRIRDGYVKVRDADPMVRQQMQELYGVSEADLAAYFIDPERARPLMMAQDYKRQATAAGIAARGLEQGGMQLTLEEAESLAARGITEQQAQTQFAQKRQLGGLFEEMGGEQALTRQQKLGAAFGYDQEALENLTRRREQRLAEFRAGGGFSRTTGATSGTIETGAGTAQ